MPKAIKRVYIRILLFYIGGTAVIGQFNMIIPFSVDKVYLHLGLLVPFNSKALSDGGVSGTAAASPFVIAYAS